MSHPEAMETNVQTHTTLFACFAFDDVDRAITFLTAIGFEERLVARDEDDPTVVHHAQFRWRDRGGIMFGSTGRRTPGEGFQDLGFATAYLVVDRDDEVDDIYAKALAVGATSVLVPEDQDYGGRSATVRDAEGNQWSFGSYAGE